MKKKPVIAYILSSIAMVLVCFGYYRRYLLDAREMLGLYSDFRIRDLIIDELYISKSGLDSIGIHVSLLVVPIFFILLFWAVRGRLKANVILTGLMFYPITAYYTHSRYYLSLHGDDLSDLSFLIAFSLSLFSIILSAISMYANEWKPHITKHVPKIIPISYFVLVVVSFLGYITLGLVNERALRFICWSYRGDYFAFILILVVLLFYCTKAVLRSDEKGHITLPVVVLALTLSIISPIEISIRLFPHELPLKIVYGYHLVRNITVPWVILPFFIVSILYFLYMCTRFVGEEHDG
jgi:hypothetical protein